MSNQNVFLKYLKKMLALFSLQHMEYLVYQVKPSAYTQQISSKTDFDLRSQRKFPLTTLYEGFIGTQTVNHAELHDFNYLMWQLGFGFVKMIGDCETTPEYQGQGIYPAMLCRIINDVKKSSKADSPLYIMVVPDNYPSIKGIERAGFEFAFHIQATRLGPFLIKRKRVAS